MNTKIITSNIRYDDPKDGIHQWKFRLKPWLECINSFAPDLIGTQEGLFPQIQTIASALKNLKVVDKHREWFPNRMYPNIFYNPDIFDLIQSGDIWLSETPYVAESLSFGSQFPRLVTWAILKIKNSRQNIFIANTHLDYLLPSTRLAQARVLFEEIKKVEAFQKHEFEYLILLGDFNEGPEDGVQEYFKKSFNSLYDPWKKLGMSEIGTHHKFDGKNLYNKRIDWVLLSANISTHEISIDNSRYSEIYPSDHFPVKLKVSF